MPRGVYNRSSKTTKAEASVDESDATDPAEDEQPTTEDTGDAGSNAEQDEPDGDDVLWPADNPVACEGPLCPEHFPAGWPDGAATSAGCEHGLWLRRTAD